MAIDYIWEGSKAMPSVPYSPATGLDNAQNIFYVSSRATKTQPGQWIPVGGGPDDIVVFETNGVPNANQLKLNLTSGGNVAVSNDGSGDITFELAGPSDNLVLVADGVTDNLAAINATLAALPPTGGTIYLTSGPQSGTGYCYVSGTINITIPGVTIIGSGWSGSDQSSARPQQGNLVLQFAAGVPGFVVYNAASFTMSNLCLFSTDTGYAAGDYGIWFKGKSLAPILSSIRISSFGDHAILLESTNTLPYWNIDHWQFNNIFAYQNFGDGLHFEGGSDGNVGTAINYNATQNSGWGINLDSGAISNVFIKPHIAGNLTGGIRVNTTSNYFYGEYMENTTTSLVSL